MEEFWILILISFYATNSIDKAESVQLEETPLNPFDEIFGEGWWDNDKEEEWHKLTLEHNFHRQIDRQNNQIGQIEPNSTDKLGQIEPNSTDQNPPLTESDHSGQIEPNSTDQNPPLTEIDHSDNAKNGEDQNEITSNAEDERKHKIVNKFHAIKNELRQKEKYSIKEWAQIEDKIAKHLKISRSKIYEWKKEFGLSRKMFYGKERKHLVEKFVQMKAELKGDGFKSSYRHEIDETVAKKLGITYRTISNWRKLSQTTSNKYPHSKQKELMNRYYKIKEQNPKISNKDIAKMLNIGSATLIRWKRQFKRQQLQSNSVEENAAANVEEIKNSNLESI